MYLKDKHLVKGVVYNREEGNKLRGWLYNLLFIYILLCALLSLIIIN